uniref:Uncharacterized protein n=1 Tax=Rangifer tarandus platyrhynchus TaxID=3082113 RepID=A0ACB0EFK6_RANTA|nr:unnamed protein product [Rangifer tarandus platyrhynchus]
MSHAPAQEQHSPTEGHFREGAGTKEKACRHGGRLQRTRRKCAKVLVLPLPVRVKAAEVRCMVSVLPAQPPEGKIAGQEATTGVWIQKCGVLWEDRKNDQELEYDLTCVSEGVTSTRNSSALVTAKEEMAPVRERPWPTQ